jgi:hypothetical protein
MFNIVVSNDGLRTVLLSIGFSPHHWVHRNLPWLALLALVFGQRDGRPTSGEPASPDG